LTHFARSSGWPPPGSAASRSLARRRHRHRLAQWLVRTLQPTATGHTPQVDFPQPTLKEAILWELPTRSRVAQLPASFVQARGVDSTPIPKGTRLTRDLPEFLSILGVRTPPIGIFFDIADRRAPPAISSTSMIEIQDILDQEPIGGKRGQEQFIDPLTHTLAYRNVLPCRRSGMSSTERAVAGLASKGLDPFGTAMLAIANQGMNVGIGDPGVRALLVGTSEALGVYSLRCSPTAFDLAPGAHRCWCWCWLHARRGSGDETTGGAIVWAARRCRRRWSVVRLAPPRVEEGRRGNQSRRPSLARQRRRQTTSRNTNT
jgi:hypothetical protein